MNKNRSVLLICVIFLLVIVLCACGTSPSSSNVTNAGQSAPSRGNTVEISTGSVEVVDVVSLNYSEAVEKLKQAGFTNISAKSSSEIAENDDRWIVVEQSVSPNKKIQPDNEIVLTCKRICNLYLDLQSKDNLFFSQYDMEIFLDDKELGTVANGVGFAKLIDVLEGDHIISFYKAGDHSIKASKSISVEGDMTFSCTLDHGRSSIDMKDISTANDISKASIEVIDVTGKVLSEARAMLQAVGITNIEEPSSVWVRGNWIVTGQSVAPGVIVNSKTKISLECIKLDDYFNATYSGHTVKEVQQLAELAGFKIKFASSKDSSDLDDAIGIMSEEEKSTLVVERARQYGGADKTAYVYVTSVTSNSTEGSDHSAGASNQADNNSGQSTENDTGSTSNNTKTENNQNNNSTKYSAAYKARASKKSYNYIVFEKDSNTVLMYEVYKNAIDGEIDYGTYTGDINSEINITFTIYKDPVKLRKNGNNYDWIWSSSYGGFSTTTYEKVSLSEALKYIK